MNARIVGRRDEQSPQTDRSAWRKWSDGLHAILRREVRAIRADLLVALASGFIDETLQAQAVGAGVRELIFKATEVEDLCAAFARLAQVAGAKSRAS